MEFTRNKERFLFLKVGANKMSSLQSALVEQVTF